ncbi:hypothetical protein SH528x_004153 [Novipirellula sp. SH528]|uniref:hypothetical protein n=1 Tax=Novipirellula sp. SH528 TaxID=3454466 RepID=UPI003F9FFB1A
MKNLFLTTLFVSLGCLVMTGCGESKPGVVEQPNMTPEEIEAQQEAYMKEMDEDAASTGEESS